MIIQLLEKIPIKIYLYILIAAIIVCGFIGVNMYTNKNLNNNHSNTANSYD